MRRSVSRSWPAGKKRGRGKERKRKVKIRFFLQTAINTKQDGKFVVDYSKNSLCLHITEVKIWQ